MAKWVEISHVKKACKNLPIGSFFEDKVHHDNMLDQKITSFSYDLTENENKLCSLLSLGQELNVPYTVTPKRKY